MEEQSEREESKMEWSSYWNGGGMGDWNRVEWLVEPGWNGRLE